MKKFFLIVIFVFSTVSVCLGAFSPTLLKFNSASYVAYSFDGSVLNIPFTQTGTPATVVFSVFTYGRSNFVNNVRNGNLGWHYVNLIDTCIYLATPKHCEPGGNVFEWNGCTNEGEYVYPEDCRYYIWGYDDTSEKKIAAKVLPFHWKEKGIVITKDENNIALSNPKIYDSPDRYRYDKVSVTEPVRFMKWNLGDDPDDTGLVMDTFINEYNSGMYFAVDPTDHDVIYHQTYDWDVSGTYYTEKMRWVPGGMAIRDDSWGTDGRFDMKVGKDNDGTKMGVYDIGYNQLLTVWSCTAQTCMDCYLVYLDRETGIETKRFDISDTYVWYNPLRGINQNRAPTSFNLVGNRMYMHQEYSTAMTCVNPYAGEKENLWLWKNMYGDEHHDYYDENPNFNGVYQYTYRGEQDSNYHVISSAYDLGALSFDLTLPDGTGAGYFSFANDTGGWKRGVVCVDSDTAYDGIYSDNGSGDTTANGWWYIAQDSISGIITTNGDYFGTHHIMIMTQNNGEKYSSGNEINICWFSPNVEELKIELSTDSGQTWETIAGKVTAGYYIYNWTVPSVKSDSCLIKLTDLSDTSVYSVSRMPFSIDTIIGVKQSSPFQFSLSQNTPNPFNPSTTIDFTTPAESYVTLDIYNIYGQKVSTLVNNVLAAGNHSVRWNGSNFSAGVYICKLKAGENVKSIKMLLVK